MVKYKISGGKPLEGTLFIQGAKNAVLPMIAASLLAEKGQTVLRNVPPLNDVYVSIELATSIGAKTKYFKNEKILVIDASSIKNFNLDSSLTTKSRASILFLPAVLHRLGKVEFHGVGGCCLGVRRLDFHHNGFKRLGARVEGYHDQLMIEANRLKGNLVYLDIPSQTSTENLMTAACLAEGTTIIENAASEPEVVDFANFLTKMGAIIHGAGTKTIFVQGVKGLKAAEHMVMADRLDVSAFMMATTISRGDVTFIGVNLEHMRLLKVKLEQMGAIIESDGKIVRVKGTKKKLKPVNVVTCPYPGFSTDFLPGIMALATIAEGTSYLREDIFEDRFSQVDGLNSLGAAITKKGNLAQVDGVDELRGGCVTAPDLRAGMSFVLAALCAQGITTIKNIYQIERGHSDVDTRLQNLGANISRMND